MEPYLLARGYGLAGSAFSVNGYNIQEGIEDTKALVSFFRDTVGEPQRTILLGLSGGHESVYKIINEAAGRQEHLLQVYTNGIGHCTFTPEQLLSTIQAIEFWLNTGTKPALSFFPPSQGFVHDFEPGPWPQPID